MAYIWPWPKGTQITQEFGASPGGVNPSGGHTGRDGATPAGTPLRSPCDGTVVFEGWADLSNNPFLLTSGGGICLVIDGGAGKPAFVMGHLSETLVNKGMTVKQGQIVAKSGNTGTWTTGPHCHLEVLPPVYDLTTNTYGRVNPTGYCTAFWEDLVTLSPSSTTTSTAATRTVTVEGANVRVAPYSGAALAPGYPDGLSKGAQLSVVGYVKGEAVTPGNDAWYKTKSGYYVWANAAGDNITGLKYLGIVAPPAAPTPAPAPAPTPAPAPAPVVPRYDFVLDFKAINGITVEKIPAHWDNYGEDFPAKPAGAVCHWWDSPAKRPSIESVINEFCYISTGKSPHFIVSDLRVIQSVSLSDRAFHAGPGGNDRVGIEIDPYVLEKGPDGKYTARALKIQANVRSLLEALKGKFGYKLSLSLHKDVPGAVTACSELILADFNIPDAQPVPAPSVDEAGVLRKFFDWLITQFLNRKE